MECGNMMTIEEKMEELKGRMRDDSIVEFKNNYIHIRNNKQMFHAQFYIEKGNRKLPSTWYIANTGSGTECVADRLMLCDYGVNHGDGSCYCIKAERLYSDSLPCRRNNERNWDKITSHNFLAEFIYGLLIASKQATKNKMNVLRFNESGDIKNEVSLMGMEYVAHHLKDIGVPTTVYTHRWDMKQFLLLSKDIVLNGSDFMLDNEFRVVDEFSGEHLKCCGDCGLCERIGRAYCTRKMGEVIEVLKH